MGLLSAHAYYGQQPQQPYAPYFGRQRQQQQPLQYRAAQPQAMLTPQLPSLTAPPNGQPMGPDPFAPAPVPPAPIAPGGVAPGEKPSPHAEAQQGGGWLARFSQRIAGDPKTGQLGLVDNPFWQLGTALLANSERGGNWGAAFQDFGDAQQAGTDRRRTAERDARESEQWSWAQEERASTSARRRMAQDYINSRPEAERAELRMIDPEQLGGYLQQQREFELQRQQLELQTQEARDNRAFRGASLAMDARRLEQDRTLNSMQGLLGRGEGERMNADMGRLSNWSLVDNDIGALEEILQRNPAAFDQITDGDQSVVLARVRDPVMRRDLNTIYAVSTNLAREELRGMTPVSNIDLLSAIRGNPNSQAGHLFVRDWLARARQDREDLQSSVQSRLQYMQGGGGGGRSLYEPDPMTGRNWYQGQDGYTRYGPGSGGPGQTTPSQGNSAEQQAAARALAERRARAGNNSGGYGNLGGNAAAPRLLRQPNAYEDTIIRQYREAASRNNQARMRELETRMRQRGLIP